MKTIILRSSPLEEKELSSLLMRFKRLGRILTSGMVICSILMPDLVRAMENEIDEVPTNLPVKSNATAKTSNNKTNSDNFSSDDNSSSPSKPPNDSKSSSPENSDEQKLDLLLSTLPLNNLIVGDSQQISSKDSDLSTSSQSLTPSPTKSSIPLHSIVSTLIIHQEEKKEEKLIDPKVLPSNIITRIVEQLPSSQTGNATTENKEQIVLPENKTSPIINQPVKKEKEELKHSPVTTQLSNEEDIEKFIEFDDNKSISVKEKKLTNIMEFLKEHFPKQIVPEKKSIIKNVLSVNQLEEEKPTEKTTLIKKDVDIEKDPSAKINLLREALLDFLAQNEEKTVKAFEEWAKSAAKHTLLEELTTFFKGIPFIQEFLQQTIEQLTKEVPECKKLTVQDWLNYVELDENSENEKSEKSEKPSQELSKFYEFFSQAVTAHVAYGLLKNKIDDTEPEAKKQLALLKKRIIDDKWDIGAIIIGTVIGMGVAVGMWAVFDGGFGYISDRYKIHWLADLIGGKLNLPIILPYTLLSVLPDAIPRNIQSWKKNLSDLANRTVEMGSFIKKSLAVFGPSLLEPTYLIITELHDMRVTDTSGLNNQFAITMLVLCPFLFLDSMTSNYQLASDVGDDIKDWLRKSDSCWAKAERCLLTPCFGSLEYPLEEKLRQSFGSMLQALSRSFLTLPEEQLEETYEAIFHSEDYLRSYLQDPLVETQLSEEEFQTAQGFFILRYLLSLGKNVQSNQIPYFKEEKSSWGSTIQKGIVALGSPARLLTLEAVLETFSKLFIPKPFDKLVAWGLAVASFPFQTALEYKGLKNFVSLWQETYDGHNSHTWARRSVKGIATLQSLMFTLPLLVLSIQVCDQYFKNDWVILGAIPFLITEFATQAGSFHSTYNENVTTKLTDVHNLWTRKKFGKEPRLDYKRDRLMRKVKEYETTLGRLPKEALVSLSNLLQEPEMDNKQDWAQTHDFQVMELKNFQENSINGSEEEN